MVGKSTLGSQFRFGSLSTTEKRTRLRSQALNYAVENYARKSFKIESEFCDGKEEERKEKPNEKEKLLRLPMAKRNGANYI